MSTSTELPGRHPVNVGHLVMGVAFLGLVGIWALLRSDLVGDGDLRWLLPVPWVLAGVGGLTAVALSGRRRNRRARHDPPTPTDATLADSESPTGDTTDTTDTTEETS